MTTPEGPAPEAATPPRRQLPRTAIAAGLCIAAGVVAILLCSSPTWLRVTLHTETGPGAARGQVKLSGSNVAAAAVPLALVAAAGLIALALVRSWARRLLGILIAAAGVGILAAALHVASGSAGVASGNTRVKAAGEVASVHVTAVPYICSLGAALIIAGGVFAVIGAGRWPQPARRYERVNAKASRPKDTWEALERGEDPTSG